MTEVSPDALTYCKKSLPLLKTVAPGANSAKSEQPASEVSHVNLRIWKGRFWDWIVEEKCPLENEYTAQQKDIA